jgi:AraC-like DNA-binding protein
VLNDTRHTLALAYLSAPRHTVSDVTFLLGFSAGSCFTRAFRRWTGQSPSAWRSNSAARGLSQSHAKPLSESRASAAAPGA